MEASVTAIDGTVPADLTPHHLRHTCASMLIFRGASVKAVQTQLGTCLPTITLNAYTHLFGDELDDLFEAVDSSRKYPVSTDGIPQVTHLDAKRTESGF